MGGEDSDQNESSRLTCIELQIAKIQAKAVVWTLTENNPIIHVRPSSGNSITDALMMLLCGTLHCKDGGCYHAMSSCPLT